MNQKSFFPTVEQARETQKNRHPCPYQQGRTCYEVECIEACVQQIQVYVRVDEQQRWESHRRLFEIESRIPRPIDRRILGLSHI